MCVCNVQVRAKTSKGWTEFSDEVYAVTGYACTLFKCLFLLLLSNEK